MPIAKRKLKAPTEPILRKSASETALIEANLEFDTLRERHKLAIVAQRENEQSGQRREAGLAVEARKLAYKIDRAATETELLAIRARAERAKTPDAQTAVKSAHRRLALRLAVRAGCREIGAVDLTYTPGGYVPWTSLLLSGWLGRAFLQACAVAFLITSAELASDAE